MSSIANRSHSVIGVSCVMRRTIYQSECRAGKHRHLITKQVTESIKLLNHVLEGIRLYCSRVVLLEHLLTESLSSVNRDFFVSGQVSD